MSKYYLQKQFVTNLSSVFAFRLETLLILSGVSEAKTPSTRLELPQSQTLTDSPQKWHRYGQSIKVCPSDNPQIMHFFTLALMFCTKRLTPRLVTCRVLYVLSSPPLGVTSSERGKTNYQTTHTFTLSVPTGHVFLFNIFLNAAFFLAMSFFLTKKTSLKTLSMQRGKLKISFKIPML